MQDCSVETCDYRKGGGQVYSIFQKVGGKYIYMASLKFVQWCNRCENKTGVLLGN